ncbi:MAG: phytanoyl-CoA dioxygenase family protein [Armatimonadetes bacterium]|nr:phytanoyl-CoA dioxygenase family protein [Armatimonadota bacterium]
MAVATTRRLTQRQIDRFRIDGWLAVEDLLPPAQVAVLAEHADVIAAGKAPNIPDTSIQLEKVFRDGARQVVDQVLSVRKLFNLAVYDEILWSHVTSPAIADIVADLLGTDDIKLYADQLFMKPPEIGAAQPWHQDSASWRDIFPMDLVTAWCAIDHATTANGCLNFVPGTQRWGMLRAPQLEPFLPLLGTPEWPIIPAPLRPGSVSFHHSLVLHQSNANTSGMRRRGYAVHYMRATSRKDETVTDAPKVPPFRQVRGRSFPGCV